MCACDYLARQSNICDAVGARDDALRSIYEQRFVCDCLVHAVPGRDQRVNVKSVAGGFLNSISDYKDYAFYYNKDKITA